MLLRIPSLSKKQEVKSNKGILIALSHYGRDEEDDQSPSKTYNPFPNIGSILIDIDAKEPEILCS